jgi:hypothetical protein
MTYNETMSGGLWAGTTASPEVVYGISIAAQGLMAAGSLLNAALIFVPTPSGGVWVASTARLSFNYVTFGGVNANGTVVPFGLTNEPPNGILVGKALIGGGGPSAYNSSVIKFVTSSGGPVLASTAGYGITNIKYSADGGFQLSSSSAVTNLNFVKSIKLLWRVQAKIEREVTFLYNVGRLRMFWYRVVSKSIDGVECPLQGNPCCQKFIITLHARTIGELCEKLSRRRYKFPIESVQKFSRPAENAEVSVDEAAGIDVNCQQLIPVEICTVPACAEFCIDQDLRETIGYEDLVQVNAFFDATASGSAFVTGASDASYVRFLPSFTVTSDGGPVVAGDSVCSTDCITGRGGLMGGGSAHSTCSSWHFVGGDWPNLSGTRFGTANETVLEKPGDQPWQLIERVNTDDSLYSQSDISYGKKSHLLVTTGFGFTIPSGSTVRGLRIGIDRLATQVGIRDLEVYLVKNGQRVSDNLAVTNVDWPLIETERFYGSDGMDGDSGWRNPDLDGYLGPLTPADLNDPTFGVAIRVQEIGFIPIAIAKINFITASAYYESATGSIIRMGGSCPARAPKYHYAAAGKTTVVSTSHFKAGYRFRTTGLGSDGYEAVQAGGGYSSGYHETTSGGAGLGGDAKVTPYFETMTGGSNGSGDANVTPYFETMIGGPVVGGKATRNNKIHYTMGGGPVLSSLTFVPQVQYVTAMAGGPVLGSTYRLRSNHFKWVSDGNVAFIFGGADTRPGSITTATEDITFDMRVLQTTATFTNDVDKQDAANLTSTLSKCGCVTVPLTVLMSQNLSRDNLLAKFLVRNNLSISSVMTLKYNATNDSWQSNLHYKGKSPESNDPELWDLVFELKCTDSIGGVVIGTNVWKLSCHVVRKNLVSRDTFDTKVIVSVLPDKICSALTSALEFSVNYDTQIGIAAASPKSTIYHSTIYDNIGLFKNQAWIADPDLLFEISNKDQPVTNEALDFTQELYVQY